MSDVIASVKLDGHIGAEIHFVPNAMEDTARLEVYNLRGQLLAYQQMPGDTSVEIARMIGFALFNGYVFGYRACEHRLRNGLETLLSGPDSPLS